MATSLGHFANRHKATKRRAAWSYLAGVGYHIHVPRGGVVTCLPDEYDTVEDAILAFELEHEDTPWCLVDRREGARAPFVLRGAVEDARVAWRSVG